MAKYLSAGNELPLDDLSPGMIIALKSAKLDLMVPSDKGWVLVSPRTDLDLWNINNDIILRITIIRGTNKIFLTDHADKSLLDGWGEEKCVELNQEDIDKWQHSGVTISVHDCSTPSNEQYQILFDLTTIYFFEKRFPGPPIKIEYSAQRSPDDTSVSGIPAHGILSDPLKVFIYNVDDLPLTEKQAVKSGSVPPVTAPPDSLEIFHGKAKSKPNPPWALISSDNGDEMRFYYLGNGNVLHEYVRTPGRPGSRETQSQWVLGRLHKLKIILDPTSSITAVLHSRGSLQEGSQQVEIHVFYQDPYSNFIRQLSSYEIRYRISDSYSWGAWQQGSWAWKNDILVTKALKGSSIAALFLDDPTTPLHLFYQDPELHVRDLFNRGGSEWYHGFLDSGIQPHGTPITAEPVYGNELRLNVTWLDERGCILSASLSSDLSGAGWCWYLSNGIVQDRRGRKPTEASTEASRAEAWAEASRAKESMSRKNKKCLIM